MKKNVITPSTTIEINIKMLLSLLGGMLILFFGFYNLVVAPKSREHDEMLKMLNQQLMEINNNIGTINGNIEGINNRFEDLQKLKNDPHETSGGFNRN